MKLINGLVSLVAVLLILAMSPAPPGKTTDLGWSGLADHPGYVTNNDSIQVQELVSFIAASHDKSCPNAGLNGAALDASVSEVPTFAVAARVVNSFIHDSTGDAAFQPERWCGYADSNAPSLLRV